MLKRPLLPVTGLAAFFGSVLPKARFKKNAKHIFLKEAKTAAFQLRSPPAGEANALILFRVSFYNAISNKVRYGHPTYLNKRH